MFRRPLFFQPLAPAVALLGLWFGLVSSAPLYSASSPSNAVRQAQAQAPEALIIEVTGVATQLAGGVGLDIGSSVVTAQATVLEVKRTDSKLKPGAAITFYYPHTVPLDKPPDYEPIPIVKKGDKYLAYLFGGPPPAPYALAISRNSLMDPASPVMTPESFLQSRTVDFSILPTPDNPEPKGVIPPLTGVALAAFAKVEQKDKTWTVTLGRPDPALPLLVSSANPPALVSLYWPDRNAPSNQPAILVYRAGSVANPDTRGLPLSVERALIVTAATRAVIGDVLWAVRAAPGDNPVPQPRWSWKDGILTVENPFGDASRQLTVIPKAEPPPVVIKSDQ